MGPGPPGLSIGGDNDMAQTMTGADLSAFMLSQSGAFKTSDFQIRPEGGLTSTANAHSPDHARPQELATINETPRLEVDSLADLEMLEELGSGASGTVFKARHISTGTLVAVKCVTILEKAKRDQVVSELRIMMSHTLGARWLVMMHNAFYEEAKVCSTWPPPRRAYSLYSPHAFSAEAVDDGHTWRSLCGGRCTRCWR